MSALSVLRGPQRRREGRALDGATGDGVTALDEDLFAPRQSDDITATACHYARAGMRVFPVRMDDGRKSPPPGYLWKARASSNVNEVAQDFTDVVLDFGDDGVGVGWALGLDGHVALDLDVDDEPDWWGEMETLGALNITRRGRHLIFKFPENVTPSNSTTRFPDRGWGEVRGVGGYIVIAAPDRPGFDAAQLDGLAEFPRPEWLTEASEATAVASSAEVIRFIAEHTSNNSPSKLNGIRSALEGYEGSRHDTAVDVGCWIAREAAAGLFPAAAGFDALRAWWAHVMDDPRRHDGREVDSILAWAIGATRTADGVARIEELRTDSSDSPPADVDPETGEIIGRTGLADEFWTARPAHEHIRTAARARRTSPSAVLGGVLARVAAWTPPTICVPPFVGGTVPLSLFVALIGSTGDGKSAPERVAAELVVDPPAGALGPVGLGSGEGAIEAYLEQFTDTNDEGTKVVRKRQARYGVLFALDEGEVLAELAGRKGQTIIVTLRTMFTGGDLGQRNASSDTVRQLGAGRYATGLISLWQPTRMVGLFDDTDGGLPGRFLFLALGDPAAPEVRPDWPGPLEWKPPQWARITLGTPLKSPLNFPSSVEEDVDAENRDRLCNGANGPLLDGHRTLLRLKVAGLLAQIDGCRTDVTEDDWSLAGMLVEHSDTTRNRVLDVLSIEGRKREETSNARAGRREVTIRDTVTQSALAAGARTVGRKAHRHPGELLSKRTLHRAINGEHRRTAGAEACIEEAVRLEFIAPDGDGYRAGNTQPAA